MLATIDARVSTSAQLDCAHGKRGEPFTAFSRLGAEGSSVEGVGPGLTLTRELVAPQRGRIAFESRPGDQTRFWVDLPMAA